MIKMFKVMNQLSNFDNIYLLKRNKIITKIVTHFLKINNNNSFFIIKIDKKLLNLINKFNVLQKKEELLHNNFLYDEDSGNEKSDNEESNNDNSDDEEEDSNNETSDNES
jgi:hypothetical protein